jgi:hypothetical protein
MSFDLIMDGQDEEYMGVDSFFNARASFCMEANMAAGTPQ